MRQTRNLLERSANPDLSGKLEPSLIFVLPLLLVLLTLPSGVYARTLLVGVDFSTIGNALKEATDGDLIEVRGGEYKERLKIQKAIHLRGVNNPVISVKKGHIVEITSPGVTIEGFTLRYEDSNLSPSDTAILISKEATGTTVRDNRLLNVMFGVWNVEGRDIRIEKNTIVGMEGLSRNARGNCVNLTGSQRVHVVNNTLSYCRDGIYMELCHDARIVGNVIKKSRYSVHTMWVDRGNFNGNIVYENLVGLAIMYTKRSEIKDNLSYGNLTHGLLFIQTVRSEITANTVIGNTKGIFFYNSVYNEFTSNLVMNNQLGLHSWGGSEDNTINGNSFINNEVQVKYVASRNQEWNKNYWSDYIGWDMTGDGTGDYPYESNSVVDYILWRYPMAKVLYASPSLQMLWVLEKQFPLFAVPRVVDSSPSMSPFHGNWQELKNKYPHTSKRFFGEIEKLPHVPGGRH
jgi:nitrous oxidase accessory protein